MRGWLVIAAMLMSISLLSAQGIDSIEYKYTPIDQGSVPQHQSSGRSSFGGIHVGENSHLSFMLAPAYTTETSLMVGAVVNFANYRPKEKCELPYGMAKNFDISLTASGSISGYYDVSVNGSSDLDGQMRNRLFYGLDVKSAPSRIWGTTYDTALRNSYSNYTEKLCSAWLGYTHKFTRNLLLGIMADYRLAQSRNMDDGVAALLDNQRRISTAGFSANLVYEAMYIAGNSMRAEVEAEYRPQLLGNLQNDIWCFTALFDYYQPLWRGATLALDLYGEYRPLSTPWLLQGQLGGSSRMRGYYLGRYRGNNLLATQLEYRQHIWNGLGIAAWGGAGVAFSSEDRFAWRKVLPTYGIGLRYRIGGFTTRLDFAFGRDSFNVILGLGEAF